jgi:hypothetical protein
VIEKTEFRTNFNKGEEQIAKRVSADIISIGITECDYIKLAILNLRSDFCDEPSEILKTKSILKGLRFLYQGNFTNDEINFLCNLKFRLQEILNKSERRVIDNE